MIRLGPNSWNIKDNLVTKAFDKGPRWRRVISNVITGKLFERPDYNFVRIFFFRDLMLSRTFWNVYYFATLSALFYIIFPIWTKIIYCNNGINWLTTSWLTHYKWLFGISNWFWYEIKHDCYGNSKYGPVFITISLVVLGLE